MQYKNVLTSTLVPYERNPRRNDQAVDAVAASIREFGFKVPIVIDRDNVVVAGHTRLKAAQKLKLETVPVIVADDLTPEQIKAFRLADNKTAELAEWDLDLLDLELGDIEMDMEPFGFELGADESQQTVEDDFDPEPPAEPKAKRGEIYQLGRHRLMCGDSTDAAGIARLLDGEKVNCVYTDPPYGMNLDTDFSSMVNRLDFARDKNIKNGRKYDQGVVDDFQPGMISSVFAVGASEVFLWGANYYAELLPDRNDGSWIVWDKRSNDGADAESAESADKMYGSCFELCWSKKAHKQDIARVKWAGVFGTEQEFDHKRHHPTQKPIKLAVWFIMKYTAEGDNVADLFGGSGSTLIACEQTNRTCYMMEIDPRYVDVIIDRWEKFTGETAELVSE